MLLAISKILGNYSFATNDVVHFNLSLYTQELTEEIYNEIQNQFGEKIKTQKRIKSKIYKDIFIFFSKKYNIDNVECIEAISRKFMLTTSQSSNELSAELLQKVTDKLPEQPWKPRIHIQIARELHLSPTIVSNAISYLIFTGQKNYQKYGYVFDNNDNIILEGDHFGFSEDDARQRKKDDYAFWNRKYGDDSFNY